MSVKITSYVPQTIKANKAGSVGGMIVVANKIVNQQKALANFNKGYSKGQTRASIMWRSRKTEGGWEKGPKLNGRPAENEVIGGTNVAHSIYPEYGTRKMAAQPFMRPGFDIVAKGVSAVKAMAKAMMDSVKKVTK